MRYFVSFYILFLITSTITGQNLFIKYDDVVNELKRTSDFETLRFKYDYEYILLLDSSIIKLIELVDKDAVADFYMSKQGLSSTNNIVGFRLNEDNIKNVFTSEKLKKKILDCSLFPENLWNAKIDYPIYIKDYRAIFSISVNNGMEYFEASLLDGILQIKWLGGTID